MESGARDSIPARDFVAYSRQTPTSTTATTITPMDDEEDFDCDIDDEEFLRIAEEAELEMQTQLNNQRAAQSTAAQATADILVSSTPPSTQPLFPPGDFDDDDDDEYGGAPKTTVAPPAPIQLAPPMRQATLFGMGPPAAEQHFQTTRPNRPLAGIQAPPEQRPHTARHNWPLAGTQSPPEPPTHHKLDLEAAKTWVYPINVSFRDYQFNIVRRALLSNVLCALPTGWFRKCASVDPSAET